MVKFEERKELEIITKTPVFIGTGEQIKPLSFVVDGKKLLIVPPDFFTKLTPDQQEKYTIWIEPILKQLSDIDRQLAIAKRNRNNRLQDSLKAQRRQAEDKLSLEKFLKSIGVNTGFIHNMNPRTVKFSRRPGRFGFREHIKHPDRSPYIPGTEIKGALRTAILFALLNKDNNYSKTLKKYLTGIQAAQTNSRKRKDQLKKAAKQTEGDLLRAPQHADDAKYDLLRFVSISDTEPFEQTKKDPDKLFIEQIKVLGSSRRIIVDHETLFSKEGAKFEIRFGAPERVISGTHLDGMKEWLTLPKLLEACYEYSKAILDEETKYFRNEKTVLSEIQYLQQDNCPSSPLLRLGAGQGFLGVTMDLKVRQQDPVLYEVVRKEVSLLRRWRTYKNNFPKTRRVVLDGNGNPSTLLGWVQIREPKH